MEVLTRELAAANDMTCDVYDVLIDTQRELGALLEDSPLENHLHPMPEVMDDTVALVDRRQELAVNGVLTEAGGACVLGKAEHDLPAVRDEH